MKTIAVALIVSILLASAALAFQNESSTQAPKGNSNNTDRGGGLTEAVKHVPDFVAEKLTYMRELFSSGIRGIGQSLSDWIHSFFSPVVKGNQTSNSTKNKTD